jgi:D-sedoheptulose 7-phosphate isomerase
MPPEEARITVTANALPSAAPALPDLDAFLDQGFAEHDRTLADLRAMISGPFGQVLAIWERTVRGGGKLLFAGNGGSAADAQHLVAELVVRYKADRPAIAAIALTTDSSILTAGGNDLGYEQVFARQVAALCRPGDALVGISTSGRSPNILAALRTARSLGAATCGLAGGDGGAMADFSDALVVIPSRTTARIQEMHIMVGHMLCEALEARLGYA